MNKPFIPTEEQFKKLQKLYLQLKRSNSKDIPTWMLDLDKIYYDRETDEWMAFTDWAIQTDYDWHQIFKECNKLWKNSKRKNK